jgi:superfamily II DNA or RNA helicase
MVALRSDQTAVVADLVAAMREHQSVLVRAPCGWGKTVLASHMALGASRKRRKVIFAVHRKELLRQTAKTFDRFGIRYGYLAGGYGMDPFCDVHIATAQTLANRRRHLKCDLFVPDEAHLWGSGVRLEIIKEARGHGAKIVPLTATPKRSDGVGLKCIADTMVQGPAEAWLIEQGFLARYRAFAPDQPDFSGLHTRNYEYVQEELEDRFSKPTVTGNRVLAYRKYADGKRLIGYCYSRKNGEDTARAFRDDGIWSKFIDGETPDHIRREVISEFADNGGALINCQLFGEGFDLSAQIGRTVPIQAVGLWCPTQSESKAIQQQMRPMRPQPDPAILLDHVNMFRDHGFPDDEREYTLEDAVKKPKSEGGEASIPMTQCAKCFYSARGAFTVCPSCKAEREVKFRKVAETEGEIVEIDREAARRARRAEQGAARTLADLVALGRSKGYRAPEQWARHVLKARGVMA